MCGRVYTDSDSGTTETRSRPDPGGRELVAGSRASTHQLDFDPLLLNDDDSQQATMAPPNEKVIFYGYAGLSLGVSLVCEHAS